MITLKRLSKDAIDDDMLMKFHHHQVINKKYVKFDGEWKIVDTEELRQWDLDKRKWLPKYFCQQIERGGMTLCAFEEEKLVGFCCVDGYLYGESAKYANLTMLFVDGEYKRKGVGKKLFQKACEFSFEKGADKIFISAISSIETIAFYFSIGCVDAKEIVKAYVDTENDRCLEYVLNNGIKDA